LKRSATARHKTAVKAQQLDIYRDNYLESSVVDELNAGQVDDDAPVGVAFRLLGGLVQSVADHFRRREIKIAIGPHHHLASVKVLFIQLKGKNRIIFKDKVPPGGLVRIKFQNFSSAMWFKGVV
jgi:hypothetical protein